MLELDRREDLWMRCLYVAGRGFVIGYAVFVQNGCRWRGIGCGAGDFFVWLELTWWREFRRMDFSSRGWFERLLRELMKRASERDF